MVLPYKKKQIAAVLCLSLISSLSFAMDTIIQSPASSSQDPQTTSQESVPQPDKTVGVWKPSHRRSPALANSSSFNCNPCCNTPEQNSPQRRSQTPTRIHVEEMAQSVHESQPSRELTSLSFATAIDFKERESKELASAQSTKNLPVGTSVSVHLDEMDKLEKDDSCMQRSLAKVSGFNRKYKINYILGGLELTSAVISLYNLLANTNPEPEWEHVVNTMAAISCIQGGLAQATSGAIHKLTKKNVAASQPNKNVEAQSTGFKRIGNFCYDNAGYLTAGLGVSVAVANLAFPHNTPAAINGIDAFISLTGTGACAIAEGLETTKEKIQKQQQEIRKQRHGTQDSVELDSRRITFSNVSTRTTENSDASSVASTARSESQPSEMLV